MAAQSATREATKKGLEEAAKKGLTGEAAKEYARQFAIETTKTTIKESTKLVGKELTKAVFHAATEKLVHYGITKTINHLGKQYIKDCRSDIESGVRKRLENLFTNRNTQKQIDHILAIDNFNKTPQFQRNLMQAASDLLQQKTTILSQFTSQLCDALMFSSNVNPIITGGAIVVKGAEIGNNVSKILDLTDEFCDRLGERIASIEQRLATIANMLHQKLTPKINHADAIKIIEILRHHGILKNDWEFDASKLGFIEGIETYDALDQGNIRELILKDVSKIELSRNSNSDLSDIEQLDFGEYVEYKAEVIDLCRRLQASLTANHSNLRRQIESDISSMVTGSIMARIQGQIISPISSSVASMASRKVTEKLTEFGSDVMKSTREMLGSREGPVGVASGDEIGGGGLLDRLFKRSKKKNVLETKKVETGEKRWELAETELFVKHIEQIIGLENETSKAQIEYVGQFINGIKYEYAAEMVHEYNEMAERSKNPPDFRQAFSNVMQRHFQGQTPGMRVNIDLLGESLGYVGDQFGRILDIQNPALKANIGAVSSMVGTRVGNILEYTGISPYIKQVHDLADQHLAKGEQKILGLALGTGIPMGASKLVGMLKSRYGTNKLVPKVSVGKLEHAKTTVIVKPNHAISDIKAPNSIHKNSHNYVGDTHIYRILDSNGKTYKIGESARGVRKKDGKSIRGEAQARKLHEQTGVKFKTQILGNFDSKKQAYEYQNQLIKRFKRVGGDKSLPGNKSNY